MNEAVDAWAHGRSGRGVGRASPPATPARGVSPRSPPISPGEPCSCHDHTTHAPSPHLRPRRRCHHRLSLLGGAGRGLRRVERLCQRPERGEGLCVVVYAVVGAAGGCIHSCGCCLGGGRRRRGAAASRAVLLALPVLARCHRGPAAAVRGWMGCGWKSESPGSCSCRGGVARGGHAMPAAVAVCLSERVGSECLEALPPWAAAAWSCCPCYIPSPLPPLPRRHKPREGRLHWPPARRWPSRRGCVHACSLGP